MKTATIRCKLFGKMGNHELHVDDDNTVRVYDDVAKCLTTLHSLSRAAKNKAVEQVEAERAAEQDQIDFDEKIALQRRKKQL